MPLLPLGSRTHVGLRIFLTCWIFYTIHFATNVVREYYPAFSLVESGSLKVDKYKRFHTDIFVHTDGHAYIGNNVAASYIAAIPLLVFDPVLDWLEHYEQARNEEHGLQRSEYRTHHANNRIMLALVQEAGLSLRFGASTAVTATFLMAPLSALLVVLLYHILIQRGVSQGGSIGLSLLYAFGTPAFFRVGVLNHNMMLMWVTFLAFHLIWVRPDEEFPVSLGKRIAAGALCGFGLALDYSGVVPLLVFFGYLIVARLQSGKLKTSILESIPFVLGSVPPVLFLLYTQWAMFGNPFLPGQYWMPDVIQSDFGYFENPYSTDGFRGFTMVTPDLILLNLFSPSYGLYTFGPLLMLALIPTWFYRDQQLILPRRERIFVAVYFFLFLMFCSANQFSRIQFNSGFRYMVLLVPLLYLAACDHLIRLPKYLLIPVCAVALANSWVISMVREPVPESWQRVLTGGLQLPWLSVLRATQPADHPVLGNPLLPVGIIALAGLLIYFVWSIEPSRRTTRQAFQPVAVDG